MTNWINCEERLPVEGVAVLIWVGSPMSPFVTISYIRNTCGVNTWARFNACTEDITHWMPLPEPPETK